MAAPEQNLNRWIRETLPRNWRATRIESTTERGIPDLIVACPYGSFWIESKAAHRVPWLRPEQYAWLVANKHAGGEGFVVHRSEKTWSIYGIQASWTPNSSGYLTPGYEPLARGVDAALFRATLTRILSKQHAT